MSLMYCMMHFDSFDNEMATMRIEDLGYSPWLTCGRSKVDQILKLPVQWQTNSMDLNGIHAGPVVWRSGAGVEAIRQNRFLTFDKPMFNSCQLFRLAM